MKEKELKLIRELILNSKRSDRDLAKEIQTTQPTIGRIRKKIEKEGYISEYSAFPDLSKLNIKLIAFISIKWNDYNKTDKIKEFSEFLMKNEFIFFSAPGEGFQGKTKIIISLHKDYGSYELFLRTLRAQWTQFFSLMDTFLVSTDNLIKNFTFSGLADVLKFKDFQKNP